MAKYEYYINCEFSYFDTEGTLQLLIYTGIDTKNLGLPCSHCGKEIKSKAFCFTHSENGAEWLFGSECVKKVFGAGLGKYYKE